MNLYESNEELLSFVKESASPYHVVQEGIRRLKKAGFSEWKLTEAGPLKPRKGYYVNVYGTTLAAFYMPEKEVKSFRIAAAHTDSPCFRVKPNPDQTKGLYGKINVEKYGGAILSTWLDRPLLLAGRVCIKGKDCFAPKEVLYSSKKPVAVIPNLAIHMNREMNNGVALKVQTDMEAILTCFPFENQEKKEGISNHSKRESKKESYQGLIGILAGELDVKPEDILDYDLYLSNAEEGTMIGYQDEMLQAPRLDNITSCCSCIHGLLANGALENTVSLIALFDNEECGSRSKQGADSSVLAVLLEKIMLASGNRSREAFLNSLLGSFLVSLDVAHATHPNHPEKADPTNPISLCGGVIIKMNTNQRYATDTSAIAAVEALCQREHIAHQKFVNHGDIAGGGTLGSILSSTVPAKTVDIGVPLLAMHSSRELIAAESQLAMNQFVETYFKA